MKVSPYYYTNSQDFAEHVRDMARKGCMELKVQFDYWIDFEGVRGRYECTVLNQSDLIISIKLN